MLDRGWDAIHTHDENTAGRWDEHNNYADDRAVGSCSPRWCGALSRCASAGTSELAAR